MAQAAYCPECGHPLDSDDHVYNVHCSVSNAEYELLMQEVAEAQLRPSPPISPQAQARIKARIMDILEKARERRDQQTQS